MAHFLFHRLWQSALVLALMSFVVYSLIGLMPGDPVDLMITADPKITAEDAARLQARRGLAEAMAQTSGLSRRLTSLEARQASIQEARMLYGRQYLDLGTRPLLDLLNAEQEIYQSRFELAGTRSDLLRLDVDCLYNTGALRTAFGLEGRNLQGVEIQP